ncbi:hypothetical protein Pla163_02800 [Planctomycetes bacterium Pla163]|uniref:Uncharacterized protein n=1 Tax=Rohdeia mirabilis TaxID=2528008 RepID=A0A518CVB9_9BACT|nr:hypothetical protein Pla163_02800 [Planctomycetes bacterium Pla163]
MKLSHLTLPFALFACASCNSRNDDGLGGVTPGAGSSTFIGSVRATDASGQGLAVAVTRTTAVTTALSGLGLGGAPNLGAAVVDASGALLALSPGGLLLRVDRVTGALHIVGPSITGATGMTDLDNGLLVAIDASGRIDLVDPASGLSLFVGQVLVPGETFSALARDPITNAVYAVGDALDRLYVLGVGGGGLIATEVGTAGLGFDAVRGAVFDPVDGVLYGADAATGSLVAIDTSTGEATLADPVPGTPALGGAFGEALAAGTAFGAGALAHDPLADTLVAIDGARGVVATEALPAFERRAIVGGRCTGLAFDGAALFGAFEGAGLGDVDRTSGAVRARTDAGGAAGAATDFGGLVRDGRTGLVFASDGARIVTVDSATGALAPFAVLGGELGALALDEFQNRLFVHDDAGAAVLAVDLVSKVVTFVASTDVGQLESVDALAFDAVARVLVGAGVVAGESESRRLVVDLFSGGVSVGDVLGVSEPIGALAFEPATSDLFAARRDRPSALYRLADTGPSVVVVGGAPVASGPPEAVGALGWDHVEGLAQDPSSGAVFGLEVPPVSGAGDAAPRLVRIDPVTGEGALIALLSGVSSLGATDYRGGLCFDSRRRSLYAVERTTGLLMAFDPDTAKEKGIRALNSPALEGLAYDAREDVVYGVTDGELFKLELPGTEWTSVGPVGVDGLRGLAYDAGTMRLFATRVSGTGVGNALVEIDPVSGVGIVVGATRFGVEGLAGGV